MQMNLKILSPEEIFIDKPAGFVSLMTETGSVGILPGHVPFAGKLTRSYVRFENEGEEEKILVDGGYALVMSDSVTVFTAGIPQ